MSTVYLLLAHIEPELERSLRRRFPTTFGGPRAAVQEAAEADDHSESLPPEPPRGRLAHAA